MCVKKQKFNAFERQIKFLRNQCFDPWKLHFYFQPYFLLFHAQIVSMHRVKTMNQSELISNSSEYE